MRRHQFSSSTQNIPSLKLDESKRNASPSLSRSSRRKSINKGPSDSAHFTMRPKNIVKDSLRFAAPSTSKPDKLQKMQLEEQESSL